MSASLVGSEMCIRDRLDAADTPPLASGAGTPISDEPPLLLSPAYDPQAAVSYTHLTLPTICSV
eukprot:3078129-Alexandrium_andersonii.AAC.1